MHASQSREWPLSDLLAHTEGIRLDGSYTGKTDGCAHRTRQGQAGAARGKKSFYFGIRITPGIFRCDQGDRLS